MYPNRRKAGPRKKRYFLYALSALFLIAMTVIAYFELRIRPIVADAAQSRAASYASEIINSAVSDALIKCTSPVKVASDAGGVSSVEVDVAALSVIRSEATRSLTNAIQRPDVMSFSLPMGSLMDSTLLAGRGTPVEIRLVPIGDIVTDVRTEFISVGINQTLHKILLRVDVTLNMFVAGECVKLEVKNDVTLAETVIVGKVPDAYTAINRFEIDEQEENDLNDYAATLP